MNWVLVAVLQRRHEHHVFQTMDFCVGLTGTVLATLIALFSRRTWAAVLATFQGLRTLNWLLPILDLTIPH